MRFLICATLANNASLPLSTTKMMDLLKSLPVRLQSLVQALVKHDNRRVTAKITVISGLFLYAVFLVTHGSSVAGGSDSSGYFNSARLIGEGRAMDTIRQIDGLAPPNWHYYYQQPLGFDAINDAGSIAPTYPIGLPLMLLASSKIAGWGHADILVNVVCALGSCLLMISLGREFCGLRLRWIACALGLMLLCPLFIFFSLQAMSDVPATFCALLVIYASAKSSHGLRWAFLAGAATGMAVLVRPTNILLVLPTAILLGINWRSWTGYVMAGIPFAIVQLLYNHALYGNALTSGYGDVFALFKTAHFPHNSVHFATWIPQLLTPVVVAALAFPWLLRQHPRIVLAMSLWCAVLIGFYVFYYHSGETWWYLRFIMPAFPFLILTALMVLQRAGEKWLSLTQGIALIAILTAATSWWQLHLTKRLHAADASLGEFAYVHTVEWLNANTPPNSIMAAMQASGALHFYTNFPLLRYDLIPPDNFVRAVAMAQKNGQEIYAPLFPFEIERVIGPKLGGEWEKVATVDYITIWRLKP